MKETELTVQCYNTYDEILTILSKQNFKNVNFFVMDDCYYSKYSIEQIKNITYNDITKNSMLIRSFSHLNTALIIYKDKIFDDNDNVVQEEKTSVEISKQDVENIKKIFEYAGINCISHIEQKLTIVSNGQIELCIQQINDLGTFIEYEEDVSVAGLNIEQKVVQMQNNLLSLGLKLGDDFFVKKLQLKLSK